LGIPSFFQFGLFHLRPPQKKPPEDKIKTTPPYGLKLPGFFLHPKKFSAPWFSFVSFPPVYRFWNPQKVSFHFPPHQFHLVVCFFLHEGHGFVPWSAKFRVLKQAFPLEKRDTPGLFFSFTAPLWTD